MDNFFKIVKESNFNLTTIFQEAPNESLLILFIFALILISLVFFVRHSIIKAKVIKDILSINELKTFDEYIEKIDFIIEQTPKRGVKAVETLSKNRDKVLSKAITLLNDLQIKEKINNYQYLSDNFLMLSTNIKNKYKNETLSNFLKDKSLELLNVNLYSQIEIYYKNTHFNEKEFNNINAIVSYANKQDNPWLILDGLIDTFKKLSFSYNLELFKFIEKLEKEKSKQIYEFCKDKIDNLFTSRKDEISVNILDYLYEKEEKEKVYDYIKTLELQSYLQQLYYLYFDKKQDLDLDLSFIANPIEIQNDYKNYIDNSLTSNWRDEKHIEYVSRAKGVLEVLGHEEFRSLIERVDRIKTDIENNKKIEEALKIAKRAESIAIEAKSFNQNSSKKNKTELVVQPKAD
ncbi:hypothetical protein CP965_00135 [Halarcobacter mediterraneus]|uniref:Uncharacterized protein n=1 Tax=Halarcobacter mediterraneus TaxID=2023153 RepID=A0A4Q1AZ11_9BACT|nr:hypothetical protein [Halarcobacter mediterraneus]RXK13892.1 hypothetical protein CP965_00135 [Halarcobacter mediterraneus]